MPDFISTGRLWLVLAVLLGACSVGTAAAAPLAIDLAADHITTALAEGVTLSLHDAPADERGLVMVATLLDDHLVNGIQRSPDAAFTFVEQVSTRYPLSAATKAYMVSALIGFSEICRDYPWPAGNAVDPHLLKLIIAFRRGIKAGVEQHGAVP